MLLRKSFREQNVVFTKFAFYLVVILTIQKPDSYSALASSLDGSAGNTNNYRPSGRPVPQTIIMIIVAKDIFGSIRKQFSRKHIRFVNTT